jgi:hypothetical protein
MFTYVCFHKNKQITVNALRIYDAQLEAAKIFKAKKPYEVTVYLAAKDNEPVTHIFDN